MAVRIINPYGPRNWALGSRPEWPLAVNTGSWQANGLAGWWPGGPGPNRWVDLVSPIHANNQASPLVSGVPMHGLTPQFESASWFNSDVVPFSASSTQPLSMCCWYRGVTIPAVYPVQPVNFWSTTEAGTRTDGTYDKALQMTLGGTGISRARFYVFDGGVKTVTGASEVMDVGPVFIVGTFDGSNMRIYVNGRSDATPVAASGTFAFTSAQFVWSHIPAGTQGVVGNLWDCRYYRRCLSDAEIAAMYALPTRWDLYRVPSRRVWFGAAAPGGTTWPGYISPFGWSA